MGSLVYSAGIGIIDELFFKKRLNFFNQRVLNHSISKSWCRDIPGFGIMKNKVGVWLGSVAIVR